MDASDITPEKRELVLSILKSIETQGLDLLCSTTLSDYMDNEETILVALKALKNVPINCEITREFALKMLAINKTTITSIIKKQPNFADDAEIMSAAADGGHSLLYASNRLKNDRQFLIAYANATPQFHTFKHIPKYADDEEFILAINYCDIYAISDRLYDNKQFLRELIKHNIVYAWDLHYNIDSQWLADIIVEREAECTEYLQKKYLNSYVYPYIVKKNGLMLKYIPKMYLTADIIKTAIAQNKEAVQFL